MRPILVLLCMCFGVQGMKGVSNITFGSLPTKERNRRLIPYMTYYLGPQNAQFRQVMAVPYVPVQQYRQVPQRYVQQPTPLTRMITQNYLAIAKQIQGNPRLQTRLVNPNIPGEVKYFLPVAHPQQSVVHIPASQFPKQHNVLQYAKPQGDEQYVKHVDNDYDIREQEHHNNEQYAKPPADSLLQYVKPEVQQYVAKFRGPISHPKQEQMDYDDNGPQTSPVQFLPKPAEHQQYIKTVDAPQYISKPDNDGRITAYPQKTLIQFIPKQVITPSKLLPQPAEIPEYITRPIPKPVIHHQPKTEKTSVTIMQSQEIEVETLPSTPNPAPAPRYHATYVARPESYAPYHQETYPEEQQQTYHEPQQAAEDLDPEVVDKNLNEILQGLSISKSLPERITSENLGSSIKTLSKILRILQRAHSLPQSAKDLVRGFPKPNEVRTKPPSIKVKPQSLYNDGSTPGRAGIDYPNYDEIPQTHFSCKEQRYKGFFGDPETGCQVWHYCDLNGGQASFLCPNGTIFSQVALTCDWWFNVKCATTAQLYVLNERLYKYILPQKPSFPEDYSGPLVDHYISLKFKEIEEKNKNKTEEHKEDSKEEEEEEEQPFSIDVETQNKLRSVQ